MSINTRPSLPALYVGTWALLMTVALAYLGMMAARPDLVAGAIPNVRLGSLFLDEDDIELRRQAFEAESLRRQLFSARAELNGLRGEVARRADRETTLALKLASLEAKEARAAEALAVAEAAAAKATPGRIAAEKRPAPPKPMTAVERLAAQAASGTGTTGSTGSGIPAGVQFAAPPTVSRTAIAPTANAPPGNPIETGTIPPSAGIQLGTGPSVDALRLNWTLLQQRHQGALQKLQPRYTTSREAGTGGEGPAYDLIAGPLPPAEAQRTCEALRAQNVACRVSGFGGNAL